ncbi:MaoC family dehydratase [Breoghania sp.]|uniref:MaoC family dehydratase n=1 Tax=Breoghania sp. TaxID=2065378 RepID=UPI0029CA6224|nr:MaoC family dehydratase [Breoghania sp.]
MRHFEDIELGVETQIGAHTFTAEEIKAFAAKYDPQSFHTDEEAAARSQFGALCASGWHTAAIWMKLVLEKRNREFAEDPDRDGSHMGPSPGFENMKWTRPVYVGDTISYSTKPVSKELLPKRPGWGIVTSENAGVNQHGERVFEFTARVLVGCRK